MLKDGAWSSSGLALGASAAPGAVSRGGDGGAPRWQVHDGTSAVVRENTQQVRAIRLFRARRRSRSNPGAPLEVSNDMRLLWIPVTAMAMALVASSCGGVPEDNGPGVDPVDQGVVQAPPAAPGASTDKVTICHHPSGDPANAQTIDVGAAALPAHLRHGDTFGACGSGGGGGGGGCGGIGGGCTNPNQCCAGLTCVDDALDVCVGGSNCTCQVLIN